MLPTGILNRGSAAALPLRAIGTALLGLLASLLVAARGEQGNKQAAESEETESAVLATSAVVTPRASTAQTVGRSQPGSEVAFGDLIDDPSEFYGQKVTVHAPVGKVYGPKVFALADADSAPNAGEDDQELGNERALVIDRKGTASNVNKGISARVTGTVREFEPAELERDLGIELAEDLYADWANRPTIVASSIAVPST